jgi:hypothetical protein
MSASNTPAHTGGAGTAGQPPVGVTVGADVAPAPPDHVHGTAGQPQRRQARGLGRHRGTHGGGLSPTRAVFLRLRRLLTLSSALATAEIAAVLAWAAFVGRPYLNFDPEVIPAGREFGQAIITHHLWERARECGLCAQWFGSARGGAPAFSDALFGSMLHPLVIVTTLAFGVLNGAKAGLVGAFALAGLAQWWLGRVLGASIVARLWTAGLAVAGGHLASRMELGTFGVLLSTAAAALVLAPLVGLCRRGTNRWAVALALCLAMAGLAGQGYMQVGLLLTLPAAVLLLPWDRARLTRLAPRFAMVAVLTLLLMAPFLVPFARFVPQFGKDVSGAFAGTQPMAFVPLHLVVSDHRFYATQALGQMGVAAYYGSFIGWLPVLLAAWALRGTRSLDTGRAVAFLAATAILAFWAASGAPVIWAARQPLPALASLASGVRYPAFIAGLAVSPILGLAALGLDDLWRRPPRLRLTRQRGPRFSLAWLALIPLALALHDAREFGKVWITSHRFSPETRPTVDALRTPDLQWVSIPLGEHWFIQAALERDLKIRDDFRTWFWKDRPLPPAARQAVRAGAGPENGMVVSGRLPAIDLYEAPVGNAYAQVQHAGGQTACTATGTAGDIDVTCDVPAPGLLTIHENSWPGWRATVSSRDTPLQGGRWLAVQVPSGRTHVSLRYRPWDVPTGVLLCGLGLALAGYWWVTPGRSRPFPAPERA